MNLILKKCLKLELFFITDNPISEKINFSGISAHKDANFTEIKSTIQSALKIGFGIKIETKTTTHPTFEQGHCATIILNNIQLELLEKLIQKLLKIIKFVYL